MRQGCRTAWTRKFGEIEPGSLSLDCDVVSNLGILKFADTD